MERSESNSAPIPRVEPSAEKNCFHPQRRWFVRDRPDFETLVMELQKTTRKKPRIRLKTSRQRVVPPVGQLNVSPFPRKVPEPVHRHVHRQFWPSWAHQTRQRPPSGALKLKVLYCRSGAISMRHKRSHKKSE